MLKTPLRLVILAFYFITFFFLSIPSYSSEDDTYSFTWLDEDKEVYILQNRKFRKKGKIYISGGFGTTTSGAFINATSLQLRASYFFRESYGFQFLYAKNSSKENSVAESIRRAGTTNFFYRIINDYKAFSFVWSPFYSKLNTFNKIIYLDWLLNIGWVKLNESNNRLAVIEQNPNRELLTSLTNGFFWSTGMMFFLNKTWDIRLDLSAIHFRSLAAQEGASEEFYSNWDATVSIGFSF